MYRVYGKKRSEARFKPFDMANNRFVTNLIYASLFQPEELGKLKDEIAYMNEHNPDYIFEIRKA